MTSIHFQLGVAAGLAISALIAIAAPFAAAFAVHHRTGAPFKYFAVGAAVFLVSQVLLRLPWQLPLNAFVQKSTGGRGALVYAFIAFSALTAGIFEEAGRWLGYRFFIKEERSWRVGVMYGLGHGGLESVLLVGLNLAAVLVVYVLLSRGFPLPIPAEKLDLIRAHLSTLTATRALAGGVERLFALCIQVALSLIVLQVFWRRSLRWLAYAVGLHFVVDFVAVMVARLAGALFAELVVGAFAAAALVVIARLRNVQPIASDESPPRTEVTTAPS